MSWFSKWSGMDKHPMLLNIINGIVSGIAASKGIPIATQTQLSQISDIVTNADMGNQVTSDAEDTAKSLIVQELASKIGVKS